MSRTLDQIYIANPITSNASTDLMYFAQSPYTAGKDAGMTYASFSAQFVLPSQALIWAANATASIAAAVNIGYILTSGSATTVTLPTTFAVGTQIGVKGQGAAWTIDIGASTNVQVFGNTYTTSIASANNVDSIVLIATVANTTWGVLSMVTAGFTAS